MEITCWENSTLSVFPQIGCNVLVMDLKKGRDISNFQLFLIFQLFWNMPSLSKIGFISTSPKLSSYQDDVFCYVSYYY